MKFSQGPLWTQLLLAGLLLVGQLPAGPVSAHPGGVDAKGCHKQAQSTQQHCHPERARAGALSREATQPPRPGEEGVLDGPLLWATDGDSLRVLLRGRDTEIRLADVDAPERDQPHGWKSKLELIDLVRGRHLVLVPRDVDQYGRIVARAWVGDLDVNRELVRRGAAWFYPQYAEDDSLYNVEQEARTAKRGLWALPQRDRMEPWMWRKKAREEQGSK